VFMWIYGNKGMGKTSPLNQLPDILSNHALFYISIKDYRLTEAHESDLGGGFDGFIIRRSLGAFEEIERVAERGVGLTEKFAKAKDLLGKPIVLVWACLIRNMVRY